MNQLVTHDHRAAESLARVFVPSSGNEWLGLLVIASSAASAIWFYDCTSGWFAGFCGLLAVAYTAMAIFVLLVVLGPSSAVGLDQEGNRIVHMPAALAGFQRKIVTIDMAHVAGLELVEDTSADGGSIYGAQLILADETRVALFSGSGIKAMEDLNRFRDWLAEGMTPKALLTCRLVDGKRTAS